MLLNQLPHFLHQGLEASAFFADYRSAFHQSHERSVSVLDPHGSGAFAALNHYLDLTIVLLLRLQDPSKRAYAINLLRSGLIDGGVVLRSEKNGAIGGKCLLQRSH